MKLIGNPHHVYLQAANLAIEEGQYIVDDENQEIIRNLIYYFTNEPGFNLLTIAGRKMNLRKSLLILGNPGSGKTFMMELFQQLVRNIPSKFNTHTCIDLKENYKKNGLEVCRKNGNLFLNDLGFEEPAFSEQHEPLSKIIFERHIKWCKHNVKTHIDTNLQPDEIAKRYGIRNWDRIEEMCNIIPLGITENSANRRKLTIRKDLANIKYFPRFFETDEEKDLREFAANYQKLKENAVEHKVIPLGQRLKQEFDKNFPKTA